MSQTTGAEDTWGYQQLPSLVLPKRNTRVVWACVATVSTIMIVAFMQAPDLGFGGAVGGGLLLGTIFGGLIGLYLTGRRESLGTLETRHRLGNGVLRVTVEGAAGADISHGTALLTFGSSGWALRGADGLLAGSEYGDVVSFEIGGPGAVTTGGGFIGGGFGAAGALEGIGIASVLNAASTRTTVKTRLIVTTSQVSLSVLTDEATPEALRTYLANPLAKIAVARAQAVALARAAHTETPPASAAIIQSTGADRLALLERLAALRTQGVLSQDEFETQKTALLAS